MDVASDFNSLSYAVPAGITGVLMVCFILYMRWQESKQDKDREEHIAKWESMVKHQRDYLTLIVETHQREMDRQYKICERNTTALEALTHHLSIVTKDIK